MCSDQNPAPGPHPAVGKVHLHAQASGDARVNQAARDQHFHYHDGINSQRLVLAGEPGDNCPYPGLTAFDAAHAERFFGRDELAAELLDRLDRRRRLGGIQVVIGPSGAGKSSLLHAGLLPRLRQGALPGSRRWPALVFTPTADPVWALATQIARLAGAHPRAVADSLVAEPAQCMPRLARVLRDISPDDTEPERVVIVVDQFEELFTLCENIARRNLFLDLLTRIATTAERATSGPAGLVLLGVRADFYSSCVDDPGLRTALQDAPLVVGAMSDAQLREAILYPAQGAGLSVEPGLVELLLRDLGSVAQSGGGAAAYEAGRLPLLAHALRASWTQRHGSTLTVRGYRNTGGIHHAVATTAEDVYDGLDEAGRRVAQALFPQLITIGEGTDDSRRRVSYNELISGSSDPQHADEVVDAFTQARLLTRQQNTVEITHDALLRAWPRLREWIDADRDWLRTRQHLADDAATWDRTGRDSSLLYRGNRLAALSQRADDAPSRAADLEPLPAAFMAASKEQERRSARRRKVLTLSLIALLVLTTGSSGAAVWQQQVALEQRDLAAQQRDASSSRLAAQAADRLRSTSPGLAADLALAAYGVSDNLQTRTSLHNAAMAPYDTLLTGHGGKVGQLSYSAERHVLASTSRDHTIRLWDLKDYGRPRAAAAIDADGSGALSPNGRILASGMPGTIAVGKKLWDITDLNRPVPMATLSDAHGIVEFSPDGRLLVCVDRDELTTWDLADPAHPLRAGTLPVDSDSIRSLAFSADGHTLAAAVGPPAAKSPGNQLLQLWDLSDPRKPAVAATLPDTHALSVAFSPRGSLLAAGGIGSGVSFWDTTHPSRPVALNPSDGIDGLVGVGTVGAVAFSHDGRTLAAAYSGDILRGNYVELTDVEDSHGPRSFSRFPMPTLIKTVIFGDGPADVLAVGDENVIHAWHPPITPDLPKSMEAIQVPNWTFTPDSHILATMQDPDDSRRCQLWRISNAHEVSRAGTFKTDAPVAEIVAVNNTTLLEVDGLGPTRLWDITDPANPSAGPTLNNVKRLPFGYDTTTNGRLLAMNGDDGLVHLWDVIDSRHPQPLSTVPRGEISGGLNLSEDGRTLLVIDQTGHLHLWDVTDARRPVEASQADTGGQISGLAATVTNVPGRRTLVAANITLFNLVQLQLWDLGDIRRPSRADMSPTLANDFVMSADGRTLALATANTIDLWDVSDIRKPVQVSQLPTPGQSHLIFSHDSRFLASTRSSTYTIDENTSSELHMWDVTDPRNAVEVATPIVTGAVSALDFNPDSTSLVASAGLGTRNRLRLIDVSTSSVAQRLCRARSGGLTQEQWQQYFPGAPYQDKCS